MSACTKRLQRFHVSIGEEYIRLNAEVHMDIMWFDGRPILHVVYPATRFSRARFLPKVSTESFWDDALMCWASVYTGIPNCLCVDEDSQFRNIFEEICSVHHVKIKISGIQSHNRLGVGELYHKPLRGTYRKLKLDHPSTQHLVLLAEAVKAMNDTVVLKELYRRRWCLANFLA